MTDKKEIIVHGVDVSECEKLAPYNGYDEETKCNPSCCQNSPNCKFKQLKRKEQECEELKEWQEANKATGICETCTHKTLLKNDELRRHVRELDKLNAKYKQALDEIESAWKTDQDGDYDFMKFKILNIIDKAKEN